MIYESMLCGQPFTREQPTKLPSFIENIFFLLFAGIDGAEFPRKKKHPEIAYKSHDFFDPKAVAHPTRASRVSAGRLGRWESLR